MSKYYTPEIEEFHVGFEYQAQDLSLDGTSLYWFKYTFEINDSLELLFKPNDWYDLPRVKYLDKEDIESLGFTSNYKKYYKIDAPGKLRYWTEVHLDFRLGIEDIIIKGFRGEENDYLFRGIIKNKSELKRLMKQLNITNE